MLVIELVCPRERVFSCECPAACARRYGSYASGNIEAANDHIPVHGGLGTQGPCRGILAAYGVTRGIPVQRDARRARKLHERALKTAPRVRRKCDRISHNLFVERSYHNACGWVCGRADGCGSPDINLIPYTCIRLPGVVCRGVVISVDLTDAVRRER